MAHALHAAVDSCRRPGARRACACPGSAAGASPSRASATFACKQELLNLDRGRRATACSVDFRWYDAAGAVRQVDQAALAGVQAARTGCRTCACRSCRRQPTKTARDLALLAARRQRRADARDRHRRAALGRRLGRRQTQTARGARPPASWTRGERARPGLQALGRGRGRPRRPRSSESNELDNRQQLGLRRPAVELTAVTGAARHYHASGERYR